MNKLDRRDVLFAEWVEVVQRCVRTLSGRYGPLRDGRAENYRVAFGELASARLFAPRFVGANGLEVRYDDASARPITLADFVQRPDLVEPLLHGRSGVFESAQLVLQTCTTCSNTVVIDGFHRAAHLCHDNRRGFIVDVFELVGPAWPADMPDMNVVCRCVNPSRR